MSASLIPSSPDFPSSHAAVELQKMLVEDGGLGEHTPVLVLVRGGTGIGVEREANFYFKNK